MHTEIADCCTVLALGSFTNAFPGNYKLIKVLIKVCLTILNNKFAQKTQQTFILTLSGSKFKFIIVFKFRKCWNDWMTPVFTNGWMYFKICKRTSLRTIEKQNIVWKL